MINKLQICTICIVLIVIVLSQFTLINKDEFTYDGSDTESVATNDKEVGLFTEIKNSKYAEPLNEVKGFVDEGNAFMKEIEKNVESLKELLDIEKNIEKMTKGLD